MFENISHEMFQAVIKPRVNGTINLHNAMRDEPLDFFLMWSSWNAIFGPLAQSNYLATCAFMDAFAGYRWSLGLPATSLDLSHIFDAGTGRRISTTEDTLTRNGMYGTEDYDFLRYCEAAILTPKPALTDPESGYDPLCGAQLLAGIDAVGLEKLSAKYPLEEMTWYEDARFSHLLHAKGVIAEQTAVAAQTKTQETRSDNASPSERIVQKLAQILYVSKDDIDVARPITQYVLDSMIAAQLRNWLFTTYGKDVSLFELLDAGMSVEKLEAIDSCSQ